jgi:hypothetical protein
VVTYERMVGTGDGHNFFFFSFSFSVMPVLPDVPEKCSAQLTRHLCCAVSPRLRWADWVCLAHRGLPTHAPLVSMEVILVPIMHSFSSHLQSRVASEWVLDVKGNVRRLAKLCTFAPLHKQAGNAPHKPASLECSRCNVVLIYARMPL